ncbi:MAG: ABC transporter substrate-binding protein [bacterium]|nr:ABC transporter substrate-binding protein [bacterium]
MKLIRIFLVLIFTTVALLPLHAERIVTLAPALTEMVFALGKGDKLVGNTKFCNYPEEAKKVTRVGGLLDFNLEILIDMKPDVIILYPEHQKKIKVIEKKAKMVVVKHTSLGDVFAGMEAIAKALGAEAEGKKLNASIKRKLDGIRKKVSGKKRKKVLLIIGRNPDKLTNMFIIGAGDFLNELLEIAGGVNAYRGSIKYPSVSIESVVAMNPDVIIELSAFNEGINEEKVMALWEKFSFISAVKSRKIKIITDDLWLIPGPRVAGIAEKMYRFFL